jgi:cytochrome c-type biogenesis protein
MTLILAFLAGLLTLINPCVLPVLPLVLGSALQAHRLGPVALASGMVVSFVALGMGITAVGHSLGLSEDSIARVGAVMMMVFGVVLLIPRANAGFAMATAGLATRADSGINRLDGTGLQGQALTGALLGAVWSPCVGPTLGGAISLASQGTNLIQAAAIMAAFAAGVAAVILTLAYTARATFLRHRARLQRLAENSKPLMGGLLLLVGASLFFHLNRVIETWLISVLPIWLQDLSVSI